MGILNITKDSFYDGGQYLKTEDYLRRIEKMLSEGADIIDIGCMATNPKSKELPPNEELITMEKALENIMFRFPDVLFSIDTWRSDVAKKAVEMGVAIINDISGGEFDDKMFATVAELQVPYIVMHTSAKPQIMQQNTNYNNVVDDVFLYLSRKVEELHLSGVNDIIIDVGFGFGKTTQQNHELLRHLHFFKSLNCPVLVGLSRKTMLYELLDIPPSACLNATTVAHTVALLGGANILRVHDVKEAKEVVKILYGWK
jgi:dihydropteroate synthase